MDGTKIEDNKKPRPSIVLVLLELTP